MTLPPAADSQAQDSELVVNLDNKGPSSNQEQAPAAQAENQEETIYRRMLVPQKSNLNQKLKKGIDEVDTEEQTDKAETPEVEMYNNATGTYKEATSAVFSKLLIARRKYIKKKINSKQMAFTY